MNNATLEINVKKTLKVIPLTNGGFAVKYPSKSLPNWFEAPTIEDLKAVVEKNLWHLEK